MADKKYFIGCDRARLFSSFSYLIRNSFLCLFKERHIPFTFDINEKGITDAILPSGADAFAYEAALKKKGIQVHVVALDDYSDFFLPWWKKTRNLELSFDAINGYKKADSLLVHFPSQEAFLRAVGIRTRIQYVPLHVSFTDEKPMSDVEQRAFRSYYAVPEKKEIILSYGSFSLKEDVDVFQTIAQNMPDKVFFFFGHGEREAMKQKTMETITRPENVNFVPYLREELYRSALFSASRLLLIGDHLSYPQFIVDCMMHSIPVTSYNLNGFPELINEKTADVTTSFSSLFHSLSNPPDEKKIEEAKNNASSLLEADKSSSILN